MLVRLTSSTSGTMVMFATHAHVLFGWMGKECTAKGVFTEEQIPDALARLQRGVEEEKQAIQRRAEEKEKKIQARRGRMIPKTAIRTIRMKGTRRAMIVDLLSPSIWSSGRSL